MPALVVPHHWLDPVPSPLPPPAGEFHDLTASVRLTLPFAGSSEGLTGTNNSLDWQAFNRYGATAMLTAPKPGTRPLSANSVALSLPAFAGTWAPGERRTLYAYHILATGGQTSATMSLGPQVQLPAVVLHYPNPGIVVERLEDQGADVLNQLAITLRNVGSTYLTAASFRNKRGKSWPVPLQWQLAIGVRPRSVLS